MTDPEQVENVVSQVAADFGQLDILINNAGINIRGAIDELSVEQFRAVQETNVTGMWLMNRSLMDDPEKYQAFLAKIPLGRWGELDEIGGLALFLASDASSFVTGAGILIDGGWTCQ